MHLRNRAGMAWVILRACVRSPATVPFLIVAWTLGLGALAPMASGADMTIAVVKAPGTDEANAFYVGNKAPLLPSPLIKLPIGNVEAQGWLRHQLELAADGMTGHLHELSPWCKIEGNAWVSKTGQGERGWEELPYWLKGFFDLGVLLKDERILAEARRWIDGVLGGQRPDGYFGSEENRKNHDLWPNMAMLYALRSFHEATGDERVIPFMTKYCRWMATLPLEHFLPGSWQKWRAGDNLDSIHWLYNRTGEAWLLDLARVNHERTADWSGGIPTWHGVNLGQCFREPGQFYQQAKDIRYLKAAERNYDAFIGTYGQVPGGLFGSDENCREGFVGPRQGTETCTMVEIMHSFEVLAKITGDPLWLDRCEEVAFNSLPAAMTPDLKGLHYLTAPDQVSLDRANKSPMIQNGGDMFSYTPYEQFRCCQHNVAFGWPYYVEHLWMATPGNGLAAVLYAASRVKAKVGDGTEVAITETTDYPFDETVELKIAAPKAVSFPLLLRVPRWCEGIKVQVNGQDTTIHAEPPVWIELRRTWKDGDMVRLVLPTKIGVTVWKKNRNSVSVSRGPLTYSLRIGERWQKYDTGRPWPGFEVFPTTPWNYGLIVDVNNPAGSFEVVKRGGTLPDQPFAPDLAPIMLKAKGKRVPQWKQETNGLVGELQKGPVRSGEPVEDITLVPMGGARLRIAAFPQIGEGPDASDWMSAAASHVNPGDTVSALNDGMEPKNSGDAGVLRFTWWPHKGTTEWVEYTFAGPRRVSWCDVYWYDDAGGCRLPASWKVLYRDGDAWKEVANPSAYATKKDGYNRVTFNAVTSAQWRIEAALQPDGSAGILEWRVGE